MRKILLGFLGLSVCLSSFVQAADDVEGAIKQSLSKVDPRIKVTAVKDSPIAGTHEVELNSGEFIYADSKGEYFLIGQLYRYSDADGFVNLTEEKKKQQRVSTLDEIQDKNLVVFAPKGDVKATVSIFTDVDCPYCRKLHDEVPKLNAMGVQVNYLAFPRQGPKSKAYRTMVSIWCAEGEQGKRDAMTAAKSGSDLDAATCDNPVLDQLSMGQMMGVTGTPALVLEDGSLVPGYVPAAQLGKMLGVN